jgi:hypothetical protein
MLHDGKMILVSYVVTSIMLQELIAIAKVMMNVSMMMLLCLL